MEQNRSSTKDKIRPGQELLKCMRCTDRGLECELGPGKSTSCVGCIEAKSKCERPGEEKTERRRKRRVKELEEPLQGKKKKARAEAKGSEQGEGSSGSAEAEFQIPGELHDLMQGLLRRLDTQNELLEQLVDLKKVEVHGRVSESEDGMDDWEEGVEAERVAKLEDSS